MLVLVHNNMMVKLYMYVHFILSHLTPKAELFLEYYPRCYYSVLVGWCFYYFVYYMVNDLPTDVEESSRTWDGLQVPRNTIIHF